jgi:DNA-directed RNA polymerase subunit RPC12/RpoP
MITCPNCSGDDIRIMEVHEGEDFYLCLFCGWDFEKKDVKEDEL